MQIVKRNVIENLIPVVIAAKHLLERNHSPLLRDMLAYLKELMQVWMQVWESGSVCVLCVRRKYECSVSVV